MKKILGSVFITLFLISITFTSKTWAETGEIAPTFTVELLNGSGNFDLSDYIGKKAVWLVFWATWCPNCAREIPKLIDIHEKYRDEVEIVAINVTINDSIEKIEKFRQEHPMPYKIAFSREVTDMYKIQGTPTQVVIDINGVIHYRGVDVPDGLGASDIKELMKKK